MKKFYIFLFAFVILINTTVYAKTGDIVGNIYSTDIKAFINGVEVPSYNIGGKTVVIVEDMTKNYYYNNQLRVLIIGGFSPFDLIEKPDGNSDFSSGNIYETDIKTYFRNKEIPCYSLNGKMAVAIEDLGGDGEFSEVGGRYFWNSDDRTITLESVYTTYIGSILDDYHVNMVIDKDYSVTFESHPIMYGETWGFSNPEDSLPKPITYNGTIIGYIYSPKNCYGIYSDDHGNCSLIQDNHTVAYRYFYEEKIKEILKDVEAVKPTREDWIEHYENQMMSVIDSLETEEYTFLYMTQPNPHGSSQMLRRVSKDGTVINYESQLNSNNLWGNMHFNDVSIDRETKKVTFMYDNEKYEIDLETTALCKF